LKIVKNNYGSKKTTQDRILERDADTGTLSAESTRPSTGKGSGSTNRRPAKGKTKTTSWGNQGKAVLDD
jgi:predicted phage gp36 major capsid-like protein